MKPKVMLNRTYSNRPLSAGRGVRLTLVLGAVALGAALSGCVSKSTAEAKARAAYQAGHQDALVQMSQSQIQSQGTSVRINGPVRNTVIPWTQGLTVKQAIVIADYSGPEDPSEIIILRRGVATRMNVNQLLSGEDMQLQPGDVLQLVLPQTVRKP